MSDHRKAPRGATRIGPFDVAVSTLILTLAAPANAQTLGNQVPGGAAIQNPGEAGRLKHPIELCDKLAGVEREICIKQALEQPAPAIPPAAAPAVPPPPVGATPGKSVPGTAGPTR